MFSNSLGFLSCLLRHSENVLGIKLQRFSPFTLPHHSESSCAVVCCILAPDFEWQIRLPTPLTFPRSRLLRSFLCFSWLLSLRLQFFLNVLWCLMICIFTWERSLKLTGALWILVGFVNTPVHFKWTGRELSVTMSGLYKEQEGLCSWILTSTLAILTVH